MLTMYFSADTGHLNPSRYIAAGVYCVRPFVPMLKNRAFPGSQRLRLSFPLLI